MTREKGLQRMSGFFGGSEFVERVLRESEEEWEKRSLLRKRGWLAGLTSSCLGGNGR
jgi:hypothetical protein